MIAKFVRVFVPAMTLLALCCGITVAQVQGPYSSGQTAVDYTADGANGEWIYALNCLTQPRNGSNGINNYWLFNRISLPTNWNSARWDYSPFYQNTNLNDYGWGSGPIAFTRNAQPRAGNDPWCMNVFERGSSDAARTSHDAYSGVHWEQIPDWRPENPTSAQMRTSRVVYSRSSSAVQWAVGTWIFEDLQYFRRTTDGWNDYSVPSLTLDGTPFPHPIAFYTVAIDDRATPTFAFAVLSSDQRMDPGTADPHQDVIPCDHLCYTTDGNSSTTVHWVSTSPWDLSQRTIDNIQVAMISTTGAGNSDYLVYLLGSDLTDPDNPAVVCKWARVINNVLGTWQTSTLGAIPSGTATQPNMIWDLVVERDPNQTNQYMLMAATWSGIYYARHNGSTNNINWLQRNGTGTGALRTTDIRDIASDASARGRNFALAGISCAYVTEDSGITWHSIPNDGRIVIYPPCGIRQRPTSMVALYGEDTRSSVLSPVNVQLAPPKWIWVTRNLDRQYN